MKGTSADGGAGEDPHEAARTIALRSLNAAPRTRAQLTELLASRGVPADAAGEVLDRFEELQLVDDAEFARMWVRSRHRQRGLPRRTLRMELQRKGVGSSDIEAALELVEDDDEASAAVDLAIRKARATAGLEPVVRRRRMMGALMRRGFNATVAAHAVRSALEAEDEAVEEEPLDGDDEHDGWIAEEVVRRAGQ